MKRKCPTPRKVSHPDREAAERHASALYRKEGVTAQVHPYKCICGSWHVGGRRKRFGWRR